jgi:FtsP/CotA-like multicopper oxidase with cupredoxin domain
MTITTRNQAVAALTALLAGALSAGVHASAYLQCPGDTSVPRDAIPDVAVIDPDTGQPRDIQCKSLTGGDGFIYMADGYLQYTFGFSDVTGMPEDQILNNGVFRANFSAPTIRTREGQELYLTLTNVGTFIRPDLFDPHTVHYHGFPNASSIFDGLPETAIAINQGASLTYYYKNIEPGTYMYHCHVEATEHMQMGMLGSLYVEPRQNVEGYGGDPATVSKLGGNNDVNAPQGYVYNDDDGSTAYDVEYVMQLGAFDHEFHDASVNVQPLPFAAMRDKYPMINGRGYPDTADPRTDGSDGQPPFPSPPESSTVAEGKSSQPISSLITATQGQRILLRLSNLGVVRGYTVTALGLPMKVVGHGARLLRGQGQSISENVYVDTTTVTLGGGESADVIIDTADVAPGTYFFYTTHLNYLSNNAEDYGGMMTEIVIN